MKGIITKTFYASFADQQEFDEKSAEEPAVIFEKGDEVEILKTIIGGWLGGGAYVIYNDKTREAMTVSIIFVDVINNELQ